MNQDTPAISIKSKDLNLNTEALKDLLLSIPPDSVRQVLDIRYGLGGWAKKVLRRFPEARIDGYEQDSATYLASYLDARVQPHNERYVKPPRKDFDLVLADFNTLTKLKRELLDDLLFGLEGRLPQYLIFTDVACCKMHLNYKSYGLKAPDLGAYWRSWMIAGYAYAAHVKRHHAASTALFVRV